MNENLNFVFSHNLVSLRVKCALSQKKLAMLTGIPLPILRMMERGQIVPDADDPRLTGLCQIFNVTAQELLHSDLAV